MAGPSDRRRTTRGSRPGGRSGPGRTAAARPARPVAEDLPQAAASAGGSTGSRGRRRPRLTGWAAILVLVVAVLTVSYASSLKAYLQQRSEIDGLTTQIAQQSSSISSLSQQLSRWKDPAYLQEQARLEGYVEPGDKAYVVLDADGNPLQPQTSLPKPSQVGRTQAPAWWSTAWASMQLAGDPPAQSTQDPLSKIDAPTP